MVGCNEQVLVPKISQLELPYTCSPAERHHLNMSFTQKAALFVLLTSFNFFCLLSFMAKARLFSSVFRLFHVDRFFPRWEGAAGFLCLSAVFEVHDSV